MIRFLALALLALPMMVAAQTSDEPFLPRPVMVAYVCGADGIPSWRFVSAEQNGPVWLGFIDVRHIDPGASCERLLADPPEKGDLQMVQYGTDQLRRMMWFQRTGDLPLDDGSGDQ